MSLRLELLGISAGSAFLLDRYAPQYSLGVIATAVILFAIQFIVYQASAKVIYPRFFSPLRHLPTPPGGDFFLGHSKRILNEPTGLPMQDWIENVPNDGLIRYSVWFNERVLVTDPKALGEVLVTKNYDFVKPDILRRSLARLLGVGILVAEGQEHKIQRKNLMPAFAYRHIKDLYPVFWGKSQELVRCLSKASQLDGQEIDHRDHSDPGADTVATPAHQSGTIEVDNWTSRATLDIIGLSGVGQDFHALQNPNNKLNQTYRTVFSPSRVGRILQILGNFLPHALLRALPLQQNRVIESSISYIKQVCRDLVAQKRKAMAEKDRTEADIVSVALESGGFSDEDLVNQMMTFLAAGHETTATAMVWAVYLLCKHPSIQSRLRQEIRSHVPSLDHDVTAADIDSCHYLHAFCTEVLRLWSPVGVTLRVADKDTSIGDHFIPKGTVVILAPRAVNTSTHLWGKDAREFRPERWLDADGTSNNRGGAASNYSFLTFLHGPRSCIGQRFAQAEFACLVAAWVGRFETAFEDGSPLAAPGLPDVRGSGVTARPKGGLWVKLKEIDGW